MPQDDRLQVRRFTQDGLDWFRRRLVAAANGEHTDAPTVKDLADPRYTEPVGDVSVQRKELWSRRDAAETLYPVISAIPGIDPYRDSGLWAWLSAVYFDSVAPKKAGGARKIQGHERHVLEGGRAFRAYRHLLAMPVNLWATVKETPHQGRLLLHGPVHFPGDVVNNVAGRSAWMQNRNLLTALDRMYWDEGRERPKSLAQAKEGVPGSLRRLPSVIDQIDMTYDLFSMTDDEILELLPREFAALARQTEEVEV